MNNSDIIMAELEEERALEEVKESIKKEAELVNSAKLYSIRQIIDKLYNSMDFMMYYYIHFSNENDPNQCILFADDEVPSMMVTQMIKSDFLTKNKNIRELNVEFKNLALCSVEKGALIYTNLQHYCTIMEKENPEELERLQWYITDCKTIEEDL